MIRSLTMSVKAVGKLKAEMDEIQAALAESQMDKNSLTAQINKLVSFSEGIFYAGMPKGQPKRRHNLRVTNYVTKQFTMLKNSSSG